MLGEVIRTHELLVAFSALESFLPSMSPAMTLELIRSGESLPAEEPVTDERTLTTVPAKVSTEMRSLAVHLVATRDVANVLFLSGLAIRIPGAKRSQSVLTPMLLHTD